MEPESSPVTTEPVVKPEAVKEEKPELPDKSAPPAGGEPPSDDVLLAALDKILRNVS